VRGSAVLVAPQGFTGVVNKRDMNVFHIIPMFFPTCEIRIFIPICGPLWARSAAPCTVQDQCRLISRKEAS
jgi:hypothetical protein